MTKRKQKVIGGKSNDKEFSQLLEDIKTIIRSHRQNGLGKSTGLGVLPTQIRQAASMVVIRKGSIRVTDRAGEQVAIIPKHWIPLFARLDHATFTSKEIASLRDSIAVNATTAELSQHIIAWAKKL